MFFFPPHIRYHSCGVSSSKATDAKVIMALHRVHIYRLPNVSQYRVKMKCHAASCGEQVKHSYVEKVHCGFLCCTLLAETLQHIKKKQKNNTHKKNRLQPEPQFFPLPRPSKGPRAICFLDSKCAKLREPRLQNRQCSKRSRQKVSLPM